MDFKVSGVDIRNLEEFTPSELKKIVEAVGIEKITVVHGWNLFYYCFKKEQWAHLDEIIDLIDVNDKSYEWGTALSMAIYYKRADLAIKLLELGSDPNMLDESDESNKTERYCESFLHYVALQDEMPLFKKLLECGASVSKELFYLMKRDRCKWKYITLLKRHYDLQQKNVLSDCLKELNIVMETLGKMQIKLMTLQDPKDELSLMTLQDPKDELSLSSSSDDETI